MNRQKAGVLGGVCLLALGAAPQIHSAQSATADNDRIVQRVLLISIDGMHALDFANCTKGIPGVNNGQPYCPVLAELQESGISYLAASTTKPSDSFPGLLSELTGGTPRSTGVFYDVSYDRSLSPPRVTTVYGVKSGPCPQQKGTITEYDESIDYDLTKLDGGGGIDPDYLPRDPNNGCKPVYPHTFVRVNTIFEVIKANGGYTAWSDKHRAYDLVNGHDGNGVDDLYTPEVNSNVVPLKSVGCDPLPDKNPKVTDWTTSFADIRCYDALKVEAVLNWIQGKTHDGRRIGRVPTIFGMNFQAVSVGEKLVEAGVRGGYTDALGTPTGNLLAEIQFVDGSIGRMVNTLKSEGLFGETLIIITAKHGQSPIDYNRLLRIPADDPSKNPPSTIVMNVLGANSVVNADEDDISMLWLANQSQTGDAVKLLEANENEAGIGEIFAGNSLDLLFNSPAYDPRTPDIIVQPNVGVVYTGGKKKIAEHGGFAHDDRNVMLLVSNPNFLANTVTTAVETTQIAPTILTALGLNPELLEAVHKEYTRILPGLPSLTIQQ